MKNKIALIAIICLIPFILSADEITIDGYDAQTTEVQEFDGMTTSPSVSPANKARIYFNSTDDRVKASENAGAYFNAFHNIGAFTGSLIPDTDDAYDIGSDTFNWQDFFLSGDIYADSPLRLYVGGELAHTWTVTITGDNFTFIDGNNFTFIDGNNFIFN